MTDRKHLKSRVRARMARTGERYAAARAHVVAAAPTPTAADARLDGPALPAAAPGADRDPATAALCRLLAHAGLPLSEPLAGVLGGGVGMGIFQFHYAKEDIGTFFIAGRHRWDDDLAYLQGALERLGIAALVTETTSARVADRQLRDALGEGGPVIAWVDAAELGTRGYPPAWSGGAYHVVVVEAIDDAADVAVVDDVSVAPFTVPLDVLARARARIGKQRHRLLRLAPTAVTLAPARVDAALRDGLRASIEGFDAPRTRSFSLAALDDWAGRLDGTGKDSWPVVFPAGGRLWDALAAVHTHVAHYGSGGGLGRVRFVAGLREASERLGDDRLVAPAARYEALGEAWSDLAVAVLPQGVPALRRTRALQDQRAARFAAGGPGTRDDLVGIWTELSAVRAEVDDCFPLDADQQHALLIDLADRVTAIHSGEDEALASLRHALG